MNPHIPTLRGLIDRRILVNFRVRPDAVAKLLPSPFRPKLVHGWAMAGICLIRLKRVRPTCFPLVMGLSSENAAHRIAVEWFEDGRTQEGVFIPRRDTSSRLQALTGDCLFPGIHCHSDFDVNEAGDDFSLAMQSSDQATTIQLKARLGNSWNPDSIFTSLSEASAFFERGAVGYSATKDTRRWDGLELRTDSWKVAPLDVLDVRSSYFMDAGRFPAGAIEFDCALLMREARHEWRVLKSMHQTEDIP